MGGNQEGPEEVVDADFEVVDDEENTSHTNE
jgi:hypothetical protein